MLLVSVSLLPMVVTVTTNAQTLRTSLDKPIPRGAKVFIAPVDGGFETYLAAGIQQKKSLLS